MSETQSAIPASATAPPVDVGEMLRRHRTKPVDPGTAAAVTAPSAAEPKGQAEAASGSPGQLLKAAQAAMTEFQKPEPKSEQTTPEQTWGSMAMAVASLGGLLTHTPVTTSLNAMAGVVKATRENDTERAKQEFDRWKVAHEASAKMVDYTLKLYDEALKTTGPRAQLAAIQAVDAQLKLNENRAFLAAAGGDPIVAARMRHAALSKAAAGATGAAAEFEGIHARNVALGEVVAGKVAEQEAALGRKLTRAERGRVFLDAEAEQKAAEAGQRTAAVAEAKPASKSALTGAALDRASEYYHSTHQLPPGFGGQADRDAIMNREAEMFPTGSGAEAAVQGASFKADSASLNSLTRVRDSATAYEATASKEFDLVNRLIPKTPEPLNMQLLTRWVRTGLTKFGDVRVPEFDGALLSALEEYAKVLTGGTGAAPSSDAARAQALSLIPPGSTTAQIKGIIEVLKQGMKFKVESYDQQLGEIKQRIGAAPKAGGRVPPKKQWIEEHRSDNPGVSDTELGAYYDRTHGG